MTHILTRIATPMVTVMKNNLSRRMILQTALAVPLIASPLAAFALSEDAAKALVERAINDINTAIETRQSDASMLEAFEQIFASYADVTTIARYCLGADARSASQAQMRSYTRAFARYLAQKYGQRFNEFQGAKIEVNSARKVKSFIEVKTTAYLRGQAPFEVAFLVSDKSGQTRFFNLFVEGVNMLLTERAEIGAMLDRNKGNLDALIKDLQSQA